jgi:hypothetical protein
MGLGACTHVAVYELTVVNGQGSGSYEAGTRVGIGANAPAGRRFVAWEGDVVHLQQVDTAWVQMTMPAEDVLLEPYFLGQNEVSFRYEVMPIIQAYCSFVGCHTQSTKQTNFTTYAEVASVSDKISSYVESGFMPLNKSMPALERQRLLDWVVQGAQHN